MESVRERILAGATVIDVRTADEYECGHYPGAKNIPVTLLPARLDEVGPRYRPVVVYCASGGRSAVAQGMLMANGFTDVMNAGGIDNMPA